MKQSISMILLSAGVVLSLIGCQKEHSTSQLSGNAVRFSATSKSAETRSAFSGDGTQDGTKTDEFGRKILTWERINWAVGDQVMIASNNATVYHSSKKHATYTIASVEKKGDVSEARVAEMPDEQELYFTDASSYDFWGVFPAKLGGDGTLLESGKVNFTIPAAQEATADTPKKITNEGKTLTILQYDTTQVVMLARKDNVTDQKVDLEFYPAFTAFEFTLLAKENVDIPLQKVIFSSESELTGSVSATITAGATTDRKGKSTYEFSSTGKTLEYTFPDNTVISKDQYLTFTFFALPQDIEGLTMTFYVGEDKNNPTIQTGTLKYNDGTGKKDITFGGCRKHCLRGVAVKSGWEFSSITLNLQAIDWVSVEKTTNEYAQATQFEISSGAVNKEKALNDLLDPTSATYTEDKQANARYKQTWRVTAGQQFTISYKVFLPSGGTWSVIPRGDTEAFDISIAPNSNAIAAAGTRVTITVTPKSGQKGTKKLYFNTYVTKGEVTYSIDSETQLYDVALDNDHPNDTRGYHYFVLND